MLYLDVKLALVSLALIRRWPWRSIFFAAKRANLSPDPRTDRAH